MHRRNNSRWPLSSEMSYSRHVLQTRRKSNCSRAQIPRRHIKRCEQKSATHLCALKVGDLRGVLGEAEVREQKGKRWNCFRKGEEDTQLVSQRDTRLLELKLQSARFFLWGRRMKLPFEAKRQTFRRKSGARKLQLILCVRVRARCAMNCV